MEVVAGSASASFLIGNSNSTPKSTILQVLPCKSLHGRLVEARLWSPFLCIKDNSIERPRSCNKIGNSEGASRYNFLLQPIWRLDKRASSHCGLFSISFGCHPKLKKYNGSLQKVMSCSEKFKRHVSVFVWLVVGVMLAMSVSVAVSKTPSWALTEENLLFLEAWRTIDRAYVDKTFNGQSWFRYRENALRNEPMKTREETYMAIRKMLATLDDPFTRFLEPEKFKSLRSGTQGALTGVGLSIGYSTEFDGSSAGLVVISAAPGGPANRAGILSGDIILTIDDTSTETMGIYDAAERLQGPEGSSVELTIRSGPEVKHLALTRERVSLNPVKSRLCEVPGLGKDAPKIGYIKLTSFNQNASGECCKEAIETLRSNNVNAFVLDLRDNSGGLFPEGIEIAKIW
ncbi:hypothetical protein L1049_017177 [Liquidambar formosana]|uniref:C-terminal processing peptidase n=1 Tax=Liquidambar formosana TaxID=63359 RepID=A0AAP0X138_LIQFO